MLELKDVRGKNVLGASRKRFKIINQKGYTNINNQKVTHIKTGFALNYENINTYS